MSREKNTSGPEAKALSPRFSNNALLTSLRAQLAADNAALDSEFLDYPTNGARLIKARSDRMDALIKSAFNAISQNLNQNGHAPHIAILAVGGYGREELAPKSDIDLLALTQATCSPENQALVEALLYLLWDLGLKVGHATRSLNECLTLSKSDMTIRTSLLEHRHLAGNAQLSLDLYTRLQDEIFCKTKTAFMEAKLTERRLRHEKHGGQRYMLEPNIKEGKGGLRDLQSMFWIAKYAYNVEQAEALIDLGVFRRTEFAAFSRAHSFLWAVRTHLHNLSGRATEFLSFDAQFEIAQRMGFQDAKGRLGVEHFMQAYFLHATRVGELTRIFLTAMEAAHIKKPPSLAGWLRKGKKIAGDFIIEQNRLNFSSESIFDTNPLNILRIFEEALRTGYLLHPDTLRLLPLRRNLIDKAFRKNPEAHKIFFRLLLDHGDPARGLRRMNECGVLASFLPDFKPILAMMQFNSYHSYTVDEHTFQCISTLSEIERGELAEPLPLCQEIIRQGVDRKVLYLALLLHDIGKGREEDHSILGARIARRVARELQLEPLQIDTVEWLVRHHLLMSDMAQKRDLSDPRTVRDFAKAVKTKKRLDLLTILTVCDIRGVGPGKLTNWKSHLLHDLHKLTAQTLENGLEAVNTTTTVTQSQARLKKALSGWPKHKIDTEIARHYTPYWQSISTENHVIFAKLLDAITGNEMRFELNPDKDRDATCACFSVIDQQGVFIRICAALAMVSANVIDARLYTTRDGYITAAFWVQDHNARPFEEAKLSRLTAAIEKNLLRKTHTRNALNEKNKIKPRERKFVVPTAITFNNEGSDIHTIIEIDTRDRPGLLYDLAYTLSSAHIKIVSSVIATYGAQVVDTFYIKDMFGLKYHSPIKQRQLEKRLRKAIEDGVKELSYD